MMPAGKYWVGDLCYVMHEEWDEVCGLFFKDRNDQGCNQGEFTLKDGRRFASFNTKWGDGSYLDQYGNSYGVDAGLIGCIRIDDIREYSIASDAEGPFAGGHIVEFATDFEVSGNDTDRRDWSGIIRIGPLTIDTDPMYSEYEREY